MFHARIAPCSARNISNSSRMRPAPCIAKRPSTFWTRNSAWIGFGMSRRIGS